MPGDENIVTQFDSARYWNKYRKFIRSMYRPITDALVEDAAITQGHTVLDVATGPGELDGLNSRSRAGYFGAASIA